MLINSRKMWITLNLVLFTVIIKKQASLASHYGRRNFCFPNPIRHGLARRSMLHLRNIQPPFIRVASQFYFRTPCHGSGRFVPNPVRNHFAETNPFDGCSIFKKLVGLLYDIDAHPFSCGIVVHTIYSFISLLSALYIQSI